MLLLRSLFAVPQARKAGLIGLAIIVLIGWHTVAYTRGWMAADKQFQIKTMRLEARYQEQMAALRDRAAARGGELIAAEKKAEQAVALAVEKAGKQPAGECVDKGTADALRDIN